jgi:hypothetical protein
MEALLQALQDALGEEAAAGLLAKTGMQRFLLYARRQGPAAWVWQPLGECIAAELLQPPRPCIIGKQELVLRLERASKALEAAAAALEALQDGGIGSGEEASKLRDRAARLGKLAVITEAVAPNGCRHHQGDIAQHSLAKRLHSALGLFLGQPEHGYLSALAGLIEAITDRPCSPIYVRRWLKLTE